MQLPDELETFIFCESYIKKDLQKRDEILELGCLLAFSSEPVFFCIILAFSALQVPFMSEVSASLSDSHYYCGLLFEMASYPHE